MQQLRENLRSAREAATVDDMLKYIGLLSSVMMRVPVGEDNVR